jgi:hypothetical protein
VIQTLGTTTNFVIKYQDTDFSTNPPRPFANAQRRAQQLMATCEDDFRELRGWFAINDGFGPSNRVTLQVEPDTLAHNYGYKSDGTTFCRMNPFDGFAVQEQADDAVQGLYVAEIIEVLMDYRNIKNKKVSWHANQSDGEGLSRVAAATLHPVGYYNLLGGPFVNTWLTDGRFNWVTDTDATDTAIDSYGCAILFIYYLRDQLGFSMSAIVQKAKDSLEGTYQALTGSSGGYNAFKALLDKYLPYNDTQKMTNLVTDDPFPILEGADRRVSLNFTEELISSFSTTRKAPSVKVRPFFTCPVGTYHYRSWNLTNKLRCIASVEGFAQPKFVWRVNGLQASDGGSITPTVRITVDDAAHPDAPLSTSGVVRILWNTKSNTSTFNGLTGELDLSNPSDSHQGHEHLSVAVEVSETFGTTDSVSQTGTGTLDTQQIRYEAKFYTDRQKCIDALHHALDRFVLVKEIPLVFTLPDPSPELRNGIRVLKQLIRELHAVGAKDEKLGDLLTRQLAETLQVPENMLMAHPDAPAKEEKVRGRS